MLDRGLEISHQTISDWIRDFGPLYAQAIRKTRGSSFQDKWHIDEVHVEIKGEAFWLWRLVDSAGEEIEVLLQERKEGRVCHSFSQERPKGELGRLHPFW